MADSQAVFALQIAARSESSARCEPVAAAPARLLVKAAAKCPQSKRESSGNGADERRNASLRPWGCSISPLIETQRTIRKGRGTSQGINLVDGGATTIWLLALCLCAGVILFGTPRDAAIISRDVALAMLPWFLAAARPGKPTESLYLDRFVLFGRRGFYFPGQPVTVSTRSGALGMPWV